MEIFKTAQVANTPAPPAATHTRATEVGQSGKSATEEARSDNSQKEIQEVVKKGDTAKLKKELQHIVDQLNKEMDPFNTQIRFGFNDKIEEMYVSVIDTKSDEVIRKIPSEEAMRLAAKMREITGIIFDKKG